MGVNCYLLLAVDSDALKGITDLAVDNGGLDISSAVGMSSRLVALARNLKFRPKLCRRHRAQNSGACARGCAADAAGSRERFAR